VLLGIASGGVDASSSSMIKKRELKMKVKKGKTEGRKTLTTVVPFEFRTS
jgi:hypothetical protein